MQPFPMQRPQFASWNQTNLWQANIELRYLFDICEYIAVSHACMCFLSTVFPYIFLSAPDMLMPELICKDLAIIRDPYPYKHTEQIYVQMFSIYLPASKAFLAGLQIKSSTWLTTQNNPTKPNTMQFYFLILLRLLSNYQLVAYLIKSVNHGANSKRVTTKALTLGGVDVS